MGFLTTRIWSSNRFLKPVLSPLDFLPRVKLRLKSWCHITQITLLYMSRDAVNELYKYSRNTHVSVVIEVVNVHKTAEITEINLFTKMMPLLKLHMRDA